VYTLILLILRFNSNNKKKMIRNLGALEQYFHDQIELNGTVNASSFLFKSHIDLFAHKEVVYKSIQLWKQTQPFLRSKVENKCFHYASDERIQNLDNVKFIYFKSNSEEEEKEDVEITKDYWKLLIEHEYTIPIDWQNGPMWRLMFIKLDHRQHENGAPVQFEYCLLITATHAVFDGHSAFVLVAGLFSIMEGVYANKLNRVKDAPVASSMEE
jgi:hypothetical protein